MGKRQIERFLREKKLNAIKKISASYVQEFKRAFLVVERMDKTSENILIDKNNTGYTEDFNDFIFDYLENNHLCLDCSFSVDTHVVSKQFQKYLKENDKTNSYINQRDLSKLKTIAKKTIREERKEFLKELKDYKNNVMIYTDGSKRDRNCGLACILNENKNDITKLSKFIKTTDPDYTNFEVDSISLGLKHIIKNEELKNKKIIITLDSDYAYEVCLNIKKDQELQDKHKELYELLEKVDFNIKLNLIKSHINKMSNETNIDYKYNKMADELANEARKKQVKKRKPTM